MRKNTVPENYSRWPFDKFGVRFDEFDPQGSYTGVPKEFAEMPVQDADDL